MGSGPIRVVFRNRAAALCERCEVADRPLARMKGLLGRKHELEAGEGLLLKPAPSIHTWFMRFPIDAIFLDRNMSVIAVVEGLRPWRTAGRRGAKAVLELRSGESRRRGVRRGDTLRLEPAIASVPVVFVRARPAEVSAEERS